MNIRNENETDYTSIQSDELSKMNMTITAGCLICGEAIEVSPDVQAKLQEGKTVIHVCDKCKAAILYARELLSFSVSAQVVEESKKKIKEEKAVEDDDIEEAKENSDGEISEAVNDESEAGKEDDNNGN